MAKKTKELPLEEEDPVAEEALQESVDSKSTTEKNDLFINKDTGARVGWLGAARISDGESGKRWETEEELIARLEPMFELDIAKAEWQEEDDRPGLRAIRDKPKRRRSPAARRRARKKAEKESEGKEDLKEEDTSAEMPDEPTIDEVLEAELMDEETVEEVVEDETPEAPESEEEDTTDSDIPKVDPKPKKKGKKESSQA